MYSHDALWKGLLQVYFQDFLELVVPDIAGTLKLEEREFLEKESFIDLPKGRKALVDLLARVPSIEDRAKLVLVHVEVERAFAEAMDRRMPRYYFHLRLKHDDPIVPIVLFLRGGEAGITRRHVEHRVGGHVIYRFSYWAIGLSAWQAKPLLERGALGVALASCTRGDRLPEDQLKLICMEALLDTRSKTKLDGAQEQLLLTAIETYLPLNEEQEMKYAERVSSSLHKTEIKSMELTWAGKLHKGGVEVGRREGVEVGRREGSLEASRRMLRMILSQRFGQLSQKQAARLERLDDPTRLESIGQRALAGASAKEIERLLD